MVNQVRVCSTCGNVLRRSKASRCAHGCGARLCTKSRACSRRHAADCPAARG